MKSTNRGIVYVLISMVLFSTGGLFIKLIDAKAFTIIFCRAIFAGLVFLPFIQWKKIRISKAYGLLVIASCYLSFLFVLTTKITTAANAVILQCTAPLWLYLFYVVVKKKKITSRDLVPRIFILFGIVAIISESDGGNILGNLLALSNGIAYAAVQYFMEKVYPFSDRTIVGINNITLCLIILVLMPKGLDFSGLSIQVWLELMFLGIFQVGIAYLLFFKGVRLISALKASIVSLVEPILNPLLVFIFAGEMPTMFSLIGFGIILFGIMLAVIPIKSIDHCEEYQ